MFRTMLMPMLLAAGALLTACTGSALPTVGPAAEEVKVIAIRLPEGTFPRFPTVAPDGTVWCSESSGEAIARIGTDGSVSHVRIPGSSNSPADVVHGPDGLIWFVGFQVIGRITADQQLEGWEDRRIGLPKAMASGPDGALWYTNEKEPPTISRITPTGSITHHPIQTTGSSPTMPGITTGPDGALWFIETSFFPEGPRGIGRMTTGGEYRRWALSDAMTGPSRITAGPDDALWFTTDRAIGRITVDGTISDFPIPPGTRPFDITFGLDGALWFTTDQGSIGRLTTSGQMTLHPIDGAEQLIGLASAQDGSLWIADGKADTLWHYTPTR
ncbi:Vgb family protein [Saccharothrix syringae]|uniref:Virginiamycin B lyase n=1 Tax=Saccharothrix syringae TaxID=103733 RepID=A0A5Q0H045_SACSY|nr:hypothetical protein [Saccharothrix syringae]QFZ19578.1 Virginiamycin B lyase [Saccharothrix syringae]